MKTQLEEMATEFLSKQLEVGLKAAIRLYYENNPWTEELDLKFFAALVAIVQKTGHAIDLEPLINDVEEEINFDGGIRAADGFHHGVSTFGR